MRRITMAIACGVLYSAVAVPQAPAALPLQNLGLEHLDIIVPDTEASARFYARVFKMGVKALSSSNEPDVFRFEDNNGIVVELRVTGS